MNKNDEKALQHAMTSFALFGGFLIGPRNRPPRVESKPQDYIPTPRKPR